MPPRDAAYLVDILESARLVVAFVEDMDRATFDEDLMAQSAVMRQLEVIGEATKRLSPEFCAAHPELPWRKMAGMRDILIHAYDHVDLHEVWHTASASVPALIEALVNLLPPEDQQ